MSPRIAGCLLTAALSLGCDAKSYEDLTLEERTGSGSADCGRWRCGFNAAQVNGRSLQTLNLNGVANADGVKIVGFVPPPLVLLHGGSGSWLHWTRQIPVFAPRRRDEGADQACILHPRHRFNARRHIDLPCIGRPDRQGDILGCKSACQHPGLPPDTTEEQRPVKRKPIAPRQHRILWRFCIHKDLVSDRFGPCGKDFRARVDAIQDEVRLRALARAVPRTTTLAEFESQLGS